jgi:hypothetical protein
MRFDYLLPEGNVVFYEKLLAGLIDSALDQKSKAALKNIPALTPGDFKTIRDRFSFCLQDKLSHEMFLSALADESRIKETRSDKSKIGF